MFETTGLDAFAERSRVELRATGERVRKKVTGDPEDLTPREAQIAALVSEGEGNRQIAAQLFVSPSTVEYHLGKVFRKLGVTSRTQFVHHEQPGHRRREPVPTDRTGDGRPQDPVCGADERQRGRVRANRRPGPRLWISGIRGARRPA